MLGLLACTPTVEPIGASAGMLEGATSTGAKDPTTPTTGGAAMTDTTVTDSMVSDSSPGSSGTDAGGLDLGGGWGTTGDMVDSEGDTSEGSGSGGQNCGDGVIEPATLELCDHELDEPPSEEMPHRAECRGCIPAGDILFVLEEPVMFGVGMPPLSGIAYADELCRAEAEGFVLSRSDECVALLLDGSMASAARLVPFMVSKRPLVRPDGMIIAAGLPGLSDGVPQVDEFHGLAGPIALEAKPWVWTGFSFENGKFTPGDDCLDWTTALWSSKGIAGRFRPGMKEWTLGLMFNADPEYPYSCEVEARLFCLCPDSSPTEEAP